MSVVINSTENTGARPSNVFKLLSLFELVYCFQLFDCRPLINYLIVNEFENICSKSYLFRVNNQNPVFISIKKYFLSSLRELYDLFIPSKSPDITTAYGLIAFSPIYFDSCSSLQSLLVGCMLDSSGRYLSIYCLPRDPKPLNSKRHDKLFQFFCCIVCHYTAYFVQVSSNSIIFSEQ